MTRFTQFGLMASLLISASLHAADMDYQTRGILLTKENQPLPVFYEKLKTDMHFQLGWNAQIKDPAAWHQAGLAKARELIMTAQPAPEFQPRIIDEQDRGSYLARKVAFNISAESRVLALMLVPKGQGPFPAALMLHDHGARYDIGKEKLVEPWGDEIRHRSATEWAAKYFSGRFPGDELAKRGYVVLVVDALGWGDRSVPGWNTDMQQALASNLFNMGSSYAGIIAQEDVRAAEFLASQSNVDKRHLAAIGFSMGAFRAWQVAALSDAVTASVVDCWMATMQGLMVPGGNQLKGQSSYTMMHPGMGRYLDYPDFAGLAAPKPMLVYAGAKDQLFPIDAVKPALTQMHAIWTAQKAADKLETRIWPEYGHTFVKVQQDAAYDWLDRQFADGRKPKS